MKADAGARICGNKLLLDMTGRVLTGRVMDSLEYSPRRSNRQKTQPCFKLEHSLFMKIAINNIACDMAENWAM